MSFKCLLPTGAQLCLAGQEDEVELFGGFGSFPGVGSRSSISGSLQISESDTETVSAAKDDLADFVDAPQAGQRWNPGKDVGRHILRGEGHALHMTEMLNLFIWRDYVGFPMAEKL